jgi:acyl-CoA synthetase (AMP-forming)/AMP-acid ligase II
MAHLPPALCPQGVNSKTFTPPPKSLTVSEICDWHYKHSESHTLYIYVDQVNDEVISVTWKTAVQGIYRISHFVTQNVQALKTSELRPTIGLCSTSGKEPLHLMALADIWKDSFTYLLSTLGIMRAGYPVFLISPYSSPAALKHLIETSGVSMILTNTDDLALHLKLSSAVAAVNNNVQTAIISQLQWSQIYSSQTPVEEGPIMPPHDLESASVILHSSGEYFSS